MKYISQILIIISITVAAELIKFIIPLPIPASIYGLVGLFLLLKTGLLKLNAVEDVADFLMGIMSLILVPASVSFISNLDAMAALLVPVLLMGLVGTVVIMGVTGRVSQWLIRRRKGGREDG